MGRRQPRQQRSVVQMGHASVVVLEGTGARHFRPISMPSLIPQEKLHESRKEFELAALKTADLVTNLGGNVVHAMDPLVGGGGGGRLPAAFADR